jgi:osmotically-inducible protein OsmY
MTKRMKRLFGLKNRFLTLLVILPFLLLLSGAVYAQEEKMETEDIKFAIETDLVLNESVPAHLIDISVENGIVTLSGSVSNILAKEKAAEVAQTIRGVRSVVNNIDVKPVRRTDNEIKTDVTEALNLDPATENYEISATVDDKVVVLKGTVDSWQEKQLAETVAKGVKGVKDIVNKIDINYKTQRSDSDIKNDIVTRLKNDVWINEALIEVKVNRGNVKLDGVVASAAEKRRAKSNGWVTGTQSVNAGDLEVNYSLSENEKERIEMVSDYSNDQIKNSIKDAFNYAPRVSPFSIDCKVDNGTATLTGTVNNLKAKKKAAQVAENTIGVWRVKNHLKVRPDIMLGDDALERKVRKAIDKDPYLEHFKLRVDALNGRVTLSGDVSSKFQRKRAEEIAWEVKGVVEVINNINYEHQLITKDDWELKLDVQEQISWSPLVNSDDVDVSVDNGVVILEGAVDSWNDRLAAENNALQAGAKEVINNLKVKNYPYQDETAPWNE